jgi:acetolactate synthase-1/2/3 large subunit
MSGQIATTMLRESKTTPRPPKKNVSEAKTMKGHEMLVRALVEEGVEVIFGYPGGAVLGIYDALFRTEKLRHILVRHEQGATHAADGYARASGKPGVVLVTSGPGATNTVTGIATAYMDSIPLVVFTGQVPSAMIGNDAFQEADIIGITRPITKHSFLVRNAEELPEIVRKAFYIATTGRPGPVVVDMPKDIMNQEGTYHRPEHIFIRGYNPTYHGHPQQIQRAAHAIREARRPLLYIGGGVISGNAVAELRELVQKTNIPVVSTLMGLGAIPADWPQFLGMLGMHGTWTANMAITTCDLLIAIGARFDDRVTGRVDRFSPRSKKIHIDIDPACISKNVEAHIPIVGHARAVIPELIQQVEPGDWNSWWAQIRQWQKEHPLRYDREATCLKPQYVIECMAEITGGEAIVVTDVGQHQMWVAQYYPFKHPRSNITSGGLGTMGFGFPASVGASLARPERPVFLVTGDGSFQMTSMELATAVKNRLPIKVVILNNAYLGMVRQWQELFFGKRYAHSYLDGTIPDFVRLAESYGATGMRIQKPEDVKSTMKRALEIKDRPVIMDFLVDPEENVFPMVPAGAALYEMIEESRGGSQ